MILCGTNGNAFRERLLRESDLISASHASEETRKHTREILQLQSGTDLHKINKFRKPRHQVPNEISKEIIKKCKFYNGQKRICSVESKENSFLSGFLDGFGKIGTSIRLTTSKLKEISPQLSLPSDEFLIP